MDIPADLLALFVGVTNAPESLATQLLRDSGLNLDAAISSFFAIQEAGGLPAVAEHAGSDADAENGDPVDELVQEDARLARALADDAPAEQPVRAPIPQVIDTLLPPGPSLAARRAASAVASASSAPDPFANTDGSVRGDELASLFRKPTHLNFSASFQHAMTSGQRRKKWIIVNIQRSDIFACHTLNRDVWADPEVEALIEEHFIFWQRDEATPDGARYKQFYRYALPPHVALIDPRSGERLRAWGGDGEAIDKRSLRVALADFVQRNSLDDDAIITSEAPPTRPGPRPGARPSAAASSVRAGTSTDTDGDLLMSEDAELAAAIAASMETSDKSDDGETSREEGASISNGMRSSGSSGLNAVNDRAASRLLSATDPALNRNRILREQQDNDFEESLALDRAKELSEQAEAERVEREAKEAVEKAKTAAEAREMKRRRVPEVPGPDCTERITELAIRLPTGRRLQRKFYATDTVENVYDYVETEVEELSQRNFELMQAYPRKSFTDRGLRLGELPAKAALIVHLLD